jgi:hypothetical protein
MARGRFIAYQPTELKLIDGKPTQATRASIAEDLRVLRTTFDGLITYGSHSGGEFIADVAASLKFRAVIVGIWDIRDAKEVANAVAACSVSEQTSRPWPSCSEIFAPLIPGFLLRLRNPSICGPTADRPWC